MGDVLSKVQIEGIGDPHRRTIVSYRYTAESTAAEGDVAVGTILDSHEALRARAEEAETNFETELEVSKKWAGENDDLRVRAEAAEQRVEEAEAQSRRRDVEIEHATRVLGEALGTDPSLRTLRGCADAVAGWTIQLCEDARLLRAEVERANEVETRHRTYAAGIAAAIGKCRPVRDTGEPATSDRQVIELLLEGLQEIFSVCRDVEIMTTRTWRDPVRR